MSRQRRQDPGLLGKKCYSSFNPNGAGTPGRLAAGSVWSCSVLRCVCVFFPLPLSPSPGTGECGMAQPVVIKHVSCCLLQRYCSSLFIKGGCSWMQRINFLAGGCLLLLWAGGGAGFWGGYGVGPRKLRVGGDGPSGEVPGPVTIVPTC